MSTMQVRSMQTKNFSASYQDTFQAFKTVLLDEGYIIKNQEYDGGTILATRSVSYGSNNSFLKGITRTAEILSMFSTNNFHDEDSGPEKTGKEFSTSINFDKINENNIETRLVLQEADTYSSGAKVPETILDPKEYKNFYNLVSVELKRRQAKNQIKK
jgi:hypothetical protein